MLHEDDEGNKSVYIGESDNVSKRLKQHLNSYASGKEVFYWNTVLIFIGDQLNKAYVRYIEHRLVEIASMSGNYKCLTQATSPNVKISNADSDVMEEFIENMHIIVSTLGYDALDIAEAADKNDTIFYCKRNNSNAKAFLTNGGVVVQKGSIISDHETPSFVKTSNKKLKEKLINSGVIINNKFMKDYEFKSPSAAASVICGSPANGKNMEWRDSFNKTIGETMKNN
ncbi:GIY-YIG nuclease family protein [Candidatus Saccharibacteria bacterium]|nr:GIY-YIG nuclease family protein [Candidatus Saccharibacteria bacterium]